MRSRVTRLPVGPPFARSLHCMIRRRSEPGLSHQRPSGLSLVRAQTPPRVMRGHLHRPSQDYGVLLEPGDANYCAHGAASGVPTGPAASGGIDRAVDAAFAAGGAGGPAPSSLSSAFSSSSSGSASAGAPRGVDALAPAGIGGYVLLLGMADYQRRVVLCCGALKMVLNLGTYIPLYIAAAYDPPEVRLDLTVARRMTRGAHTHMSRIASVHHYSGMPLRRAADPSSAPRGLRRRPGVLDAAGGRPWLDRVRVAPLLRR